MNQHLFTTKQDPARKKEVEALLGELPGNDFDRLVALGKRMTDYVTEAAVPDVRLGCFTACAVSHTEQDVRAHIFPF